MCCGPEDPNFELTNRAPPLSSNSSDEDGDSDYTDNHIKSIGSKRNYSDLGPIPPINLRDESSDVIIRLSAGTDGGITSPHLVTDKRTHSDALTHTNEKPHVCPDCEERFTRPDNLKRHKRIHTGEKPHRCPMPSCGERFAESGQLKAHKLRHTDEKPLGCPDPGCSGRFKRPGDLKVHIRRHTGEKPYCCPKPGCGKRFPNTGQLAAHISTYPGEKRHGCPDPSCDRSFRSPGELKIHKRSHTGEKPYTCPDCGRSYSGSPSLARHRKGCIEQPTTTLKGQILRYPDSSPNYGCSRSISPPFPENDSPGNKRCANMALGDAGKLNQCNINLTTTNTKH